MDSGDVQSLELMLFLNGQLQNPFTLITSWI
jgi:hypothetical protein